MVRWEGLQNPSVLVLCPHISPSFPIILDRRQRGTFSTLDKARNLGRRYARRSGRPRKTVASQAANFGLSTPRRFGALIHRI